MWTIVSIFIAIALTTVAGGVGIYYGGKAIDESSASAEVARYRNEAQQITSAMTLYAQEKHGIDNSFNIADLAPKYLKSIPGVSADGHPAWQVTNEKVIRTNIAPKVCFIANRESGFTFRDGQGGFSAGDGVPVEGVAGAFVPNCAWAALSSETPCCYSE